MKAARVHEIGKPLQVENISDPTLRAGSVIIKVLSAHIPSYTKEIISGKRNYALPELPFTPGTSAIGVIEAIADDVFGLEIGQKVFCDPYIYSSNIGTEPDGILLGWTGLAEASPRIQHFWKNGVFAEKVLFPAESLIPLEAAETFAPEKLACLNYLTVAYGALKRAQLRPSQTLVINGATGGLGTAAVLAALAIGTVKIIVVGRDQERLKELVELDDKRIASVTVEGDVDSDSKKIKTVADNSVDVVIDFLGGVKKPEPTLTCFNSLRRGGTAVFVGGVQANIPLPYSKIMVEQLNVKGSFMYSRSVPSELLQMVSARTLNLDAFKVHTFKLNEIEMAIDKISSFKGLDYGILVPV